MYSLNLLISLLGTDALSVSGSPSFRTRASFHHDAYTCTRSIVEHIVARSTKARLEITRASAWVSLGSDSGNMVQSTRHSEGNSGLPAETLFRVVYSSADAIRGPIRSPDRIPSSGEFLESKMIRVSRVWHHDDMDRRILADRLRDPRTCSFWVRSSKRNHRFLVAEVGGVADRKIWGKRVY